MITKVKVMINFKVERILDEDLCEFANIRPSGEFNNNEFLCNILINTYLNRVEEQNTYIKEFSTLTDDIDIIDTIVTKAISLKSKLNKKTLNNPASNCTKMIYTNSSNIDIINEIIINGAAKSGVSSSAYFRSLFNEYAEKSKIEREEIYFNDIICKIVTAADDEKILSLIYENKSYLVAPDCCFEDFEKYNYYLMGIDVESKKSVSFKISKIKQLLTIDSYYKLSKEEKHLITDRYCSGYMGYNENLIQISYKLTSKGKEMFDKQYYLYKYNISNTKINNIRYSTTSEELFFNFFISFGKEIEIINPESMKKRFLDFYKESYGNFK